MREQSLFNKVHAFALYRSHNPSKTVNIYGFIDITVDTHIVRFENIFLGTRNRHHHHGNVFEFIIATNFG